MRYSLSGDFLRDFFCDRFLLSATVWFFELRDLGRLVRRIFSIAWVLAMDLPSCIDSNWSHNSRFAKKRFISRDRSNWHLMHRPVGRCLRKTQLDVLFIFCPPAPEPRTNFSNKCAAVIPSASIRNSNAAIFSEVIGLGTIKIKLESLKLTRPENLSGFEQRLEFIRIFLRINWRFRLTAWKYSSPN